MRTLHITAAVCAVASGLAWLAASAVTVVPSAEAARGWLMVIAALSLAFWGWLALWAGRRLRAAGAPRAVPLWVRGALVGAGMAFVLGVLLLAAG